MITSTDHINGLISDLRLQAVDFNKIFNGRKSLTPIESVELFLKEELQLKIDKQNRSRQKNARLPYMKTLDAFDFGFQRSVTKEQMLQLSDMTWVEQAYNICFLGPPGVGKTHLATAIGIEAASKRISTYFINFAVLMEKFKQAAKENRVEKVVKHYLKYTVLIIDEIGYLPVDKDAAFGFFQLIAARYEFRPTILTTNQPFSKWPDVFGDAVIANAIIDRLVHHCDIVKITGHSYRIKGRNIFDDSDD